MSVQWQTNQNDDSFSRLEKKINLHEMFMVWLHVIDEWTKIPLVSEIQLERVSQGREAYIRSVR